MGFWNFFGLSSKKDNDLLVERINHLSEMVSEKMDANEAFHKHSFQQTIQRMEELNRKFINLFSETYDELEKQNKESNELFESNFKQQETQITSLEKVFKKYHSYSIDVLNKQNVKILQLEEQLNHVEKLNEELVKSMQAVWLVQLSQQIDEELVK